MREMLFRGKLKYGNEPRKNEIYKKGDWVEGDYVKLIDGDSKTHYIYGYGEVIPETVGQFTGLTDKNGQRIFEGDIISEGKDKYIIEYRSDWACFLAKQFGGSPNYSPFLFIIADKAEIIGNKYDNQELLTENAKEEN